MGSIAERAWAEVELSAIAHNLKFAQVRVGSSVGIMAIVKSNAYGHGAVEVAREVERQGGRALGVASPAEGVELRQAGIRIPILVTGSSLEDEIEAAVDCDLSLSLSPPELLTPILSAARKLKRTARVHLLIDTGMSRDGVKVEDALELAEHIAETPELVLDGTYTHFATAALPDKTFCYEQLDRFNRVLNAMLGRDIHPGNVHCANSSAVFTLPASHFDMVRQGISLYGIAPSAHIRAEADLMPAMTVKTRVMSVQQIGPGESVGYFREYVATRPTRLATLAMGYADGLRLAMSHKGQVLIHGRRASYTGRVMMDTAVVDVTSIPGVRAGDEVTIIGKSGRNEIKVEEVAALWESTPYEVFSTLGRRVRLIHTRNGKPVIPVPVSESRTVQQAAEPTRIVRPAETFTP